MFSQDEDFRYLLWRIWNPNRPFWSFGMLNPSTADHMKLDPTVKRCCLRALNGGAGGLIVWNLFAWRATDPVEMKRVADPVGPFNDEAIRLAVAASSLNIAAWGSLGVYAEVQNGRHWGGIRFRFTRWHSPQPGFPGIPSICPSTFSPSRGSSGHDIALVENQPRGRCGHVVGAAA